MLKQTAFLSHAISLYQGWSTLAAEPDWTGTVEEFWDRNDSLTYGDISDMRLDLLAGGSHRMGGGASPCFTVRYAAPAEVL